jgi:hypothetical protein
LGAPNACMQCSANTSRCCSKPTKSDSSTVQPSAVLVAGSLPSVIQRQTVRSDVRLGQLPRRRTGWTWPAGYPDMAGTGPSEGDTTPAQREAPPPKERRPIRCRFVWASALGRVGRDRVLHRCSATGAVRSAAQLAHGCAKTHSSRRGFHRSDRVECSWHLLVTPYPLHGSGAGSRRRGTTIQRQIQRASRVWCCRRSTRRRRSLASPVADARLAEHRTVP